MYVPASFFPTLSKESSWRKFLEPFIIWPFFIQDALGIKWTPRAWHQQEKFAFSVNFTILEHVITALGSSEKKTVCYTKILYSRKHSKERIVIRKGALHFLNIRRSSLLSISKGKIGFRIILPEVFFIRFFKTDRVSSLFIPNLFKTITMLTKKDLR